MGETEADAILAVLDGVAPGGVFEEIPDGESIPRWPDGSMKAHLSVSFGEPIPLTKDRAMAANEADQPHSLPISVTIIGGSGKEIRLISQQVNARLIGFVPDPNDSGQIAGRGGFTFPVLDGRNEPSQWHRVRLLEVNINLAA